MAAACSNDAQPKHLSDLVSYFKSQGYTIGDKTEKSYDLIGAKDGFAITLNGQQVEFYEFDPNKSNPTLDKVKSNGTLEVMGFSSQAVANGNLILVGYDKVSDGDKIVKTFKDFK